MAHVVSYGFIKRISHNVGQRELMLTYRRVLEEENSIAVSLVNASIKLDHAVDFPKSDILDLGERLEVNPFAASILRHLVLNYFHLFPVKTTVKQRVCEKLHIPVASAKPVLSGQKKIASR